MPDRYLRTRKNGTSLGSDSPDGYVEVTRTPKQFSEDTANYLLSAHNSDVEEVEAPEPTPPASSEDTEASEEATADEETTEDSSTDDAEDDTEAT